MYNHRENVTWIVWSLNPFHLKPLTNQSIIKIRKNRPEHQGPWPLFSHIYVNFPRDFTTYHLKISQCLFLLKSEGKSHLSIYGSRPMPFCVSLSLNPVKFNILFSKLIIFGLACYMEASMPR